MHPMSIDTFAVLHVLAIYILPTWAAPFNASTTPLTLLQASDTTIVKSLSTTIVTSLNTTTTLGIPSPTSIETLVRTCIDAFITQFAVLQPAVEIVSILYLPDESPDHFSISVGFNIPSQPTLVGQANINTINNLVFLKFMDKPLDWVDKRTFSWEDRPMTFPEAVELVNHDMDLAPEETNPADSDIMIEAADQEIARVLGVEKGTLLYMWAIFRDGWIGYVIVDSVTKKVMHRNKMVAAAGRSGSNFLVVNNQTVTEVA